MALRLSGMAAKNFALFVYAVLKDQKKTHGKTRLVRMLREQRPLKFFTIPTEPLKKLQEKYFFYMWNEEINEARFVTSWDTTEEDIDDMIRTLDVVFG